MAKQEVTSGGYKFETYISPLGGSARACYVAFDSTQECAEVTRKIEQELVAQNIRWTGREHLNGTRTPEEDFIGSNDIDLLNDISKMKQYLYPNELTRGLNNLSSITQSLKVGSSAKKSRFELSAQSTGIFNFSSASKGLYRKREYFAPTENRLIDQNKVYGNPSVGFYTNGANGQKIPLEVRQENTTEMLRINRDAVKMQTQGGMIYTNPIRFGTLALKFATTNKRVYLVKKQIKSTNNQGSEKYVDVYITPSASFLVRPENIMFAALPSLLLAQILEQAGFKVRVNKYLVTVEGDSVLTYSYPVKNYGDPVDVQRLMIDCSDPRIFRWEDFRRFSAMFRGVLGIDLGGGYGRPARGSEIPRLFNEYKHWVKKKIESGEKQLFNKNLNLHLFATLTPNNDDFDTQMQRVREKLCELIDAVSLQFSDVSTVLKEAVEREMGNMTRNEVYNQVSDVLRNNEPRKCADASLDLPDSEFANLFKKWEDKTTQIQNEAPNYQ
jgi:hypothetical protein